jgi:hypothetical protein
MRTGTFAAVAVLSTLAVGCGGSGGSHLQHPTLDQDYASRFAGTWAGSGTVTVHGQPPQTTTGSQRIDRTGFNRLSVAQVCPGLDGQAGLDSATTFSMDPVTCAPVSQPCGPVTIRYDSGTANLAQNTLTLTLQGNASGCGQTLDFSATFTGTLGGGTPAGCDAPTGAGPINPAPSNLWQPAPGSTPATGNYVHLQSDAGDYIGQGMTITYTPADTAFSVSTVCNRLTMIVGSPQIWQGDFQGMAGTVQLQAGYYENLERYPFHNTARGGLSWSGQGRGCNTLTGWFVVDSVTYTSGTLSAIDLRFEQHCEGGVPALHGKIHWTAGP